MSRRLILALCTSLPIACAADADADTAGSGETDTEDGGGSTGAAFDEDATIARALAYTTTLTQVNAESRPSQHGLASTVNVWADDGALAAYLALDPAAPGAAPTWSPDALLVKEHLDGGGVPTGLTVMAQGDPDATSDGWWWARLDVDGTVHETGQVGFCISCHTPVEASGWAFGVPLDNRR